MTESTTEVSRDQPPIFVSLGMFILDELRFPHLDTVFDVPGGSGFYATLGARLFRAPPSTSSVGCIITAGYDLPASAARLLDSWQMTLHLVRYADRQCTRGLLEYENDVFSRNTFSYVTPPLRPSPDQLVASNLLRAESFHFLALPDDLQNNVSALLRLREDHGITKRPLIVWEPAPMGCKDIHLESHLKACALVDVFSPNRSELSNLVEGTYGTDLKFSSSVVEAQSKKFLEAGIGPDREGLVVVRSGEHGVLVVSNSRQPEWLPTYYATGSDKVVDPTGAGNSFLGAFAVALQETKDPREAALRGSVAASYALEQFGPPELTATSPSSGELWNGSDVLTRLRELKARVSAA